MFSAGWFTQKLISGQSGYTIHSIYKYFHEKNSIQKNGIEKIESNLSVSKERIYNKTEQDTCILRRGMAGCNSSNPFLGHYV
jgi:hypothetical protein